MSLTENFELCDIMAIETVELLPETSAVQTLLHALLKGGETGAGSSPRFERSGY